MQAWRRCRGQQQVATHAPGFRCTQAVHSDTTLVSRHHSTLAMTVHCQCDRAALTWLGPFVRCCAGLSMSNFIPVETFDMMHAPGAVRAPVLARACAGSDVRVIAYVQVCRFIMWSTSLRTCAGHSFQTNSIFLNIPPFQLAPLSEGRDTGIVAGTDTIIIRVASL